MPNFEPGGYNNTHLSNMIEQVSEELKNLTYTPPAIISGVSKAYVDSELSLRDVSILDLKEHKLDNIMNFTPSISTDTGIPGQLSMDSSYLYLCVSLNTWGRIPLDFSF
jgi:hypothetical protein